MALPDPIEIFGAERLAYWLRAEDFATESWPDITGNLTLVQTNVARQPAPATGINGLPTVLSDGVNDYMQGNLVSPLVIGSRPATFLLIQLATASDIGVFGSGIIFASTGVIQQSLIRAHTVGPVRTLDATQTSSPSPVTTYEWTGPLTDLNPHVLELGYPASATNHYYIDAVAQNTLGSGVATSDGIVVAPSSVVIANNNSNQSPCSVHYRDIVSVRDQPSDSERTALRAWLATRRDHVHEGPIRGTACTREYGATGHGTTYGS